MHEPSLKATSMTARGILSCTYGYYLALLLLASLFRHGELVVFPCINRGWCDEYILLADLFTHGFLVMLPNSSGVGRLEKTCRDGTLPLVRLFV